MACSFAPRTPLPPHALWRGKMFAWSARNSAVSSLAVRLVQKSPLRSDKLSTYSVSVSLRVPAGTRIASSLLGANRQALDRIQRRAIDALQARWQVNGSVTMENSARINPSLSYRARAAKVDLPCGMSWIPPDPWRGASEARAKEVQERTPNS